MTASSADAGGSIDAFLTGADLSTSSIRVHREALEQLARQLDAPVSFDLVDAERLEHAAVAACSPPRSRLQPHQQMPPASARRPVVRTT